MKKFKGTQSTDIIICELKNGFSLSRKGHDDFVIRYGNTLKSESDINLFKDALNTIQKCDLMPSELYSMFYDYSTKNDLLAEKIIKLQDQRKELIECLENIKNACHGEILEHAEFYNYANNLLTKNNETK